MTREEIQAMRDRKQIPGIDQCQKYVSTKHGPVLLEGTNWNSIADVLERIYFPEK
jgi:hypothetical protein